MRMTPAVIVFGGLVIFAPILFFYFGMPYLTMSQKPSKIWRPRTAIENAGRAVYVNNGCMYCHTQFVRVIDWGVGAERIAQAGDYVADSPCLEGTERIGPDLSEEGGEHPDDWHLAHFANPRFTRPESYMPSWTFLGPKKVKELTAYVQSLGFKLADGRAARQKYWKAKAIAAFESGPDKNVKWLHAHVPEGWRKLPNPYPTSSAGLGRGHRMYQEFCIGCHGPVGDGMGPAEADLYPPPLNFTILRGRGITGGILYYQIMNGITGTGMPYFKRDLQSEKIWDVGNYVAVTFIGQTDAGTNTNGIGAAYEPARKNAPYEQVEKKK